MIGDRCRKCTQHYEGSNEQENAHFCNGRHVRTILDASNQADHGVDLMQPPENKNRSDIVVRIASTTITDTISKIMDAHAELVGIFQRSENERL